MVNACSCKILDNSIFLLHCSTPALGLVTRAMSKALPSRKALWDTHPHLSTLISLIDTEAQKHTQALKININHEHKARQVSVVIQINFWVCPVIWLQHKHKTQVYSLTKPHAILQSLANATPTKAQLYNLYLSIKAPQKNQSHNWAFSSSSHQLQHQPYLSIFNAHSYFTI